MFKLTPNPTFPAKVKIPLSEGGEGELSVTFKHKSRAEVTDYWRRAMEATPETEAALAMEILAGWDNADETFSVEAVGKLLQGYHGAGMEILTAYLDALSGARRKN